MPQSLAQIYVHLVFSTKDRESFIVPDVQPRLHAYLAGTLNAIDCLALEIGGMPDHVHFVADPLGTDWRLLLRSMKSFTAHQINKRLHRHGAVWQSQYHDHRISTDAQLLAAIQYCLLNPVRAGLVVQARDWPFSWCRFEV